MRTTRLALVLVLLLPAAASAQGTPGLAPLAGTGGCVASPDSSAEGCAVTNGLVGARDVVLSPDEADVYVVAGGPADGVASDGVVGFRRDAATGALRPNGCITASGGDGRVGSDGLCEDGDALDGALAAAVSPDGATLYVAAGRTPGLSILSRDDATGKLTQRGCVTSYARGSRCAYVPALDGADDVAVSPDGRNVYVTAGDHGVLASFARDEETGGLTFLGCLSDTGLDGVCTDGRALRGAHGVTVAPDGTAVYVTATMGAVTAYTRDPETGVLTTADCLVAKAPEGAACVAVPALADVRTLALSPDGAFLYVGASTDAIDGAPKLTVLRRGATPGALTPVACYAAQEASGDDDQYTDDEDLGDEDLLDDEDGDDVEAEDAQAGRCTPAKRLDGTVSLAVAADGRSLLAVSSFGIAAFARDAAEGTLRQTGCAEYAGDFVSCPDDRNLTAANTVVASEDGRSAYLAAGDRVLVYGAAVEVGAARRLAGHRLRVTLRCPRARAGGCRGRVSAHGAGRRYAVRAGGRRTVRLRVRRARGTVAVRATDARGVVRPVVRRVRLRR